MNSLATELQQNPPTGERDLNAIIIALGAGAVLGLILIAQGNRSDKGFNHPMHSPNDRSRFATVRALGDNGTYAIGSIHEDGSYTDGSVVAEPGWDTIDKVLRPDNHLLYSSKPPLLPTLLALEYMVLKKIPTISYSRKDGWQRTGHLTFAEHPQALVRILVVTTNWLPLLVYLLLFSRLLRRISSDSWVRAFAIAAAAGGTYLSGFSVTLNNHTLAAFCAFFALYPVILIWVDGRSDWWLFAISGLLAGFTAVLELPALALTAALFAAIARNDLVKSIIGSLWDRLASLRRRDPLPKAHEWQWDDSYSRDLWNMGAFAISALIPIAAHCITNYQVTGSIRPAYENKDWYVFEGSYWKKDSSGRLVGTSKNPVTGELIIGDPGGIDNQYEPWYIYLFHMWLGHHGVLSLTPVLVFAAVGLTRELVWPSGRWTPLAMLTVGLTVLMAAFYTIGPACGIAQRNYGGMCNGMRWLFWLIPLWLMFVPAGLEWKINCRAFRLIALVLLIISAASAFYASRNPWTRPWLHELLYQSGWIGY